MCTRSHLFILFVSVLSLCGATEYYVKPTEPTNTSCPAQPCLTLSQYINNSDNYFQSNTIFKFLPGIHHMDRPLDVRDVQSMSLESYYSHNNEWPHLVAQFSWGSKGSTCVYVPIYDYYGAGANACCATVWLSDSQNITLKGISITSHTPGMSGIIVQRVLNMNI